MRSNAPAANCGLRRFDIVLEIGGNQIKNAGDVIKVFDEAPVGKVRTGVLLAIRPRVLMSKILI